MFLVPIVAAFAAVSSVQTADLTIVNMRARTIDSVAPATTGLPVEVGGEIVYQEEM